MLGLTERGFYAAESCILRYDLLIYFGLVYFCKGFLIFHISKLFPPSKNNDFWLDKAIDLKLWISWLWYIWNVLHKTFLLNCQEKGLRLLVHFRFFSLRENLLTLKKIPKICFAQNISIIAKTMFWKSHKNLSICKWIILVRRSSVFKKSTYNYWSHYLDSVKYMLLCCCFFDVIYYYLNAYDLLILFFWNKNIVYPLLCYWLPSHHEIMTQPHLHSCYTIDFNYHISSYFSLTMAHLIYFLQTTVHFIHFYLPKFIRFTILGYTHYIVNQLFYHFYLLANLFSGN